MVLRMSSRTERRKSLVTTARRLPLACLLLASLMTAGVATAQDVTVTIDDPSPNHVHAPDVVVEITLTLSDPGIAGSTLYYQWLAPDESELSPRTAIAPDAPTTLQIPGQTVGHYDLRISSDSAEVRFPPQDAGFHRDFGFSVLPPATVEERELDRDSFFGMVHAQTDDPYLRGWMKTLTWDTLSAFWFAERIVEYYEDDRVYELPVLSGADWESDDEQPVDAAKLDAIGTRFGEYLDELIAHEVSVPAWQLGVEINIGDGFDPPFALDNLAEKAARVRAELDSRGLTQVKLVTSLVGFNYDEFTAFAESAAAEHFDVLGFDAYKWNEFETPESEAEWLRVHIQTLRQILEESDAEMELWMTEFGIPHQGNNDPEGFFGYLSNGAVVEGASRDYAGRYLVKAHVIAMAEGVERLFVYNYYDRGNDHTYPEDHFGLRAYEAAADLTKDGHTKPAYVAYALMAKFLSGKEFVGHAKPQNDIWLYDFSDPSKPENGVLVVWLYSEEDRAVSLAELKPGLVTREVQWISDIYGTRFDAVDEELLVGGTPVFVGYSLK